MQTNNHNKVNQMKTITHEQVKAIGILNNKLRLLEASIKNEVI